MSILSSPWAAALLTGAAGVAQGYTAANEAERRRAAAERERYGQLDYVHRQQLIDKQNEEKSPAGIQRQQLGAAQLKVAEAQSVITQNQASPQYIEEERQRRAAELDLRERAQTTSEGSSAATILRLDAEQKDRIAKEAKAATKKAEADAKQDAKDAVKAAEEEAARKLIVQLYDDASTLNDDPGLGGEPSPREKHLEEVRKLAISTGNLRTLVELKQGKQQPPVIPFNNPALGTDIAQLQLGAGTTEGGMALPPVPPPGTEIGQQGVSPGPGASVPTGNRADTLAWSQDFAPPTAGVTPPNTAPGAATKDPAQRATAKEMAMAPPPKGWGYSEAQAEQWLTSKGW